MKVNEIFLSIQGEGLSAGFPTVFVRFAGCNLRCGYCDTKYAYHDGNNMTTDEIMKEINKYPYKRVCLTGGEPLLQSEINSLLLLLQNHIVTIETNGSVTLDNINMKKLHSFVMDMKTPSSGCCEQMMFSNFKLLSQKDEIKFVIGSRNDYEWAKSIIDRYYIKATITFSPCYGEIAYSDLAEWILEDKLDVRFQLQLHKLVWNPYKRRV